MDDHVPFAELGIPTLDLIIKFWDLDNGWPYHHTQQDMMDNISPESLDLTGKTLLQFTYQNYNAQSIKETPIFSQFSLSKQLIYILLGSILVVSFGVGIYTTIKKKNLSEYTLI